MVTILRTFFHLLQVAVMVSAGFVLLSVVEGGYPKKLANLISRNIPQPDRKASARSRL